MFYEYVWKESTNWLWNLASFEGNDKDAIIYVESITTVHNLLFYVHTLRLNNLTITFPLISCYYKIQTYICWRLRPEVQPLTLLYTIFDRKGTFFVYLPLKNGTPFTYLLKSTAFLFLTLGRKSSCRFHVAFNKLKWWVIGCVYSKYFN